LDFIARLVLKFVTTKKHAYTIKDAINNTIVLKIEFLQPVLIIQMMFFVLLEMEQTFVIKRYVENPFKLF
jgi:hypothetical protein